MINDFIKEADMPKCIIEKYKLSVPDELVSIWDRYGIGSFFKGYLRIINPEEYIDLIKDTYFRGNESIPVFVTAFGDVITWEKGTYVGIIDYKNGKFDIMIKSLKNFFRCLEEQYFINKFFEVQLYQDAKEKLGELNINECFGYVPLLGLGGNKSVENLSKVRTLEHIELIAQVMGNIGM